MTAWLNEFGIGISAHLLYFVLSIILIAVFIAVYTAITPYREVALIREGNQAAAVSLGGAVLGFALPLAQSVAQSGDLEDMLTWSGVALVAQLAAYAVTRLLLPVAFRQVDDALAETVVTRPRAEWMTLLEVNDVPFAPVHNIPDVIDDPQVREILPFVSKPILSYGLADGARVRYLQAAG